MDGPTLRIEHAQPLPSIAALPDLAEAMIAGGRHVDWQPGEGREPEVDKPCIGGIPANRVSMLTAPIVAEDGMWCPKSASRAIISPPAPGAMVFDGPVPRAGVVAAIDDLRLARIARLAGAPQVAGAGADLPVRLGDVVQQGQPLDRRHACVDADRGSARRMALPDSGSRVDAAVEWPIEFVGGGDLS